NYPIRSYADIGCGSGGVTKAMKNALEHQGFNLERVEGFDVSPHLSQLQEQGIEFKVGEFSEIGQPTDLVTLTDVIEHVTNPVEFIARIAEKAKVVVFHIPLDDCLAVNFRNMQRRKIQSPGHLTFFNINSALNLITYSGLQILDFDYSTETLAAPSNNETFLQKISSPLKRLVSWISPWLMTRIFGGSIVVVAVNERFKD
ncbi:MAG: methyltransferase domain-containing protein, partial [Algoriphagus sp.]